MARAQLSFRPRAGRSAFTLVEVLVSMTILLIGIVAIAGFFPARMRQNQRAIDTSTAAYLAQLKAEELRRDTAPGGAARDAIRTIKNLTSPTPPVAFGFDSRFAYSFSGVSVQNPDAPKRVARVIVRYNQAFRPQQEVLYELAFDR
ncbi:MAG TPA: prepilin-type N-terminal cleavage/methylation domain-containing protein [Candidatus Sumerlaeota bacterium]|nr:prepilin-type N-terminal cleavage/methylation domain-containing protein [Candidatus Sumerlaeota bacterium]